MKSHHCNMIIVILLTAFSAIAYSQVSGVVYLTNGDEIEFRNLTYWMHDLDDGFGDTGSRNELEVSYENTTRHVPFSLLTVVKLAEAEITQYQEKLTLEITTKTGVTFSSVYRGTCKVSIEVFDDLTGDYNSADVYFIDKKKQNIDRIEFTAQIP